MKKRIPALLLALTLCFTLFGCASPSGSDAPSGSSPGTSPGGSSPSDSTPAEVKDVHLRVWGAEEDQVMLKSMLDAFADANKAQINFTYDLGVQGEGGTKDTVLVDIEAAADVYAFAHDQIGELYKAGALQEVLDNVADIKSRNVSSSVEAATVDGKLMAYPMTADNGYFMFYNSSYFTEDDVKSFDGMLAKAEAAGKKISMELTSGWYNYAFFKAGGLNASLNDDGVTNDCDWNGPGGTDVLQAMLDLAKHPAFVSLGSDEFKAGVIDGSVIAGVSGTWNAGAVAEAWGESYAASKLPTVAIAGEQKQLGSFSGYKLIGVNAFCQETGWAMRLADYLTNYDNSLRRFNERQQGPSNTLAAASDAVKSDPAQLAIATQMQFATPQIIGGNYWSPAQTLGEIIVQGNPSGTPLQTLLDNAVAGITAPVG
ncbi:MAG: extracellular solute-binding protein [Oscillospiraceae bacterium]|jgi:arabinogalactan oligomer/maltooligosaccharide transport system substrate-binding protein|nr:extracellular solute-binding protein [Oscillospiraceae bacterium]